MKKILRRELIIVKCPYCEAKFPEQNIKKHITGKHKKSIGKK